jgi:hypothetical protein
MQQINSTIQSIDCCLEDINKSGQIQKMNLLSYSYLAYEYTWLIGKAYPYWKEYKMDMKRLSFLLEYTLSDKVKKVKWLYNVMPLKFTAFACYCFIKLKR